jgi:hypothetical protein
MTTPSGQPVNIARDDSRVGVQAQNAYFDSVTLPGPFQLTVGQDASSDAKFKAGVRNLKSGNPRMARKLIWDAMMSDRTGNDVLFHWLVAMLSGRTVRQFSSEEIEQLKRSRYQYDEAGKDAWADGVRLIYRLLDSVLPSLATGAEQATAQTDMSLLLEQYEDLKEEQRDMVRPHLDLFLRGPLEDQIWQRKLRRAQSQQLAGGRLGRAWMFFQPIPAEVSLPSPRPEQISAATRFAKPASACLCAIAIGYFGWEQLSHGAFLGLLGCVAALAGGAVAARADLEWRFLTARSRRKDELFLVPNRPSPPPAGDELAGQVDKLFDRYFRRYSTDKAERGYWEAAVAGMRRFHRDEILGVCRARGIPANEVAWLIRYEVRQLKQRWLNGTLHEYRRQFLPRPGTGPTRWIGLAVLTLGGLCAVAALRAYPVADAVAVSAAVPSAFCAWRYWLRVNLERRRYAADSEEHAQRQAAVERELKRWRKVLEARPKDADMAAWLDSDRTVLLGRALDHFHLSRSRLSAHAFHEEPDVAVRRARIEGGPWRYAGYRLLVFLLAEDGVRQVKANLAFMTGALTIRERTSYRYDAIVSVHVLRDTPRGQTFKLRLAAGDPITIRVRDPIPGGDPDQGPGLTDEAQQVEEAEEDTAPDMTSMANVLHMLEGAAGEGPNWFQGQEWAGAWSVNDDHLGKEWAGSA